MWKNNEMANCLNGSITKTCFRSLSGISSLFRGSEGEPNIYQNMAPKIVAEYAKSARAACKQCGNSIGKGSTRLGIVSKAAGGFDVTRWYHLHCFPSQGKVIATDNINGFALLKASDQEALKSIVAEFGKSEGPALAGASEIFDKEGTGQKSVKLLSAEMAGSDRRSPKKLKVDHTPNQEDGLQASEKIAAFDFDGCLAKTSVKRVGADAWSLHFSSIPEKLQSYYNNGYKLVIFTNESNIDRWKNSRQKAVDSKLGRLEGFIKRVKIPIQVFVACGIEGTGDPFRKPKPGMWRLMEQHFNSGIAVDMEQSFYVGDAAGRINDHSDADIGFAKAVGLKFFVPEDFFALVS